MTQLTSNFEWLKQFGTPGGDYLQDTAFDSAGNLYLIGQANGILGGTNPSSNSWITKYDTGGDQLLSVKQLGNQFAKKVTDSAGNVYLAGTTATTSPMGFNEYKAWVAKYDSTGNLLWLKNFDFTQYDEYPSDIAVDNADNIYLTGTSVVDAYTIFLFSDIIFGFDGGRETPWVAKYDGSGNQLWLKGVESGGAKVLSHSMKVDSSGNVYLMGTNDSSLPIARYSLNNRYAYFDTWATKYDSNGNQLWLQQLGTAPSGFDYSKTTLTLPSKLAVDSAGNLYLTGTADGALGDTNNKSQDIWATKYDRNGDRLWLKQFGSREDDSVSDLVVDSAGNIYLTGTTKGALGGSNAGSVDTWEAKYDSNGNRLWLKQFGGREDDSFAEAVTPRPIIGTDRDDFLVGDRSNDTISGKQGNDTINGFDGSDRIYGDRGDDSLEGSKGNDSLYGGKGNDTLLGGNGDDVLMGDRGADSLNGGDGNDILLGGKGNDTLFGGLGDDTLTGGNGSDRFLLSANSGADTITDFEDGKDLLSLNNGLTFSQLSITQENNATFIRLSATGEILASLNEVSASLLNAADFSLV